MGKDKVIGWWNALNKPTTLVVLEHAQNFPVYEVKGKQSLPSVKD